MAASPIAGNKLDPFLRDGSVGRFDEKDLAEPTQMVKDAPFKILAGLSNAALAEKVCKQLGVPMMLMSLGRHKDGEIDIQLGESVRNSHIYVLQSTCPPVNDNLMELFLIIRCLRRASAKSITAVMPYFGYARQDRKTQARVPISASDVAIMIEKAGADRVLAVDLHCGQIQGFFHNAPVDNLSALRDMAPFVVNTILPSLGEEAPLCIVSPDAGGVARAKEFLNALTTLGISNITLAITVKHRAGPGEIEGMNVVGEIDGKHCIIIDDMIDTAGTLCKSAETLKEMGARTVSACATHGLFNGPALQRIGDSCMSYCIVSDTIPVKGARPEKIKVVSSAPLIADAIQCINSGQSLSGLFKIMQRVASVV
mmetsp:Transcript_16738/g.33475  ORF Transcript_16738/g.33475 Transcript_16738/m.33475 type:complete len:369 (+) Transcript_16738:42-1148(+)|eukprot:CAMPEP_0181326936 /NCGR_PEP_ID=MMETSP1101-20121128/21798_1 /TAXON_ID=46948 /ORGANISM="Rhodomonas abbreviata, Strain Caron Lab Isolate" /LENGTH=368 /DNA_ID=CAMNT_0023435491 /DNA_START=42 /DNA_END=1148 /DNA_ORIENTATION=+